MDDLISRKAVMDIIQGELNLNTGYDADIALFSVKKCVSELPTAYNVEKVGAELEKEIQWAETHGTSADFRKGRISGLKTAIRLTNDIVKRGGVDGKE